MAGVVSAALVGSVVLALPAQAQTPEPPTLTKRIVNDPGRPFSPGETAIFEITVTNPKGGADPAYVRFVDYISSRLVGPFSTPIVFYDPSESECIVEFEPGGVGHKITCTHLRGIPAGGSWTVRIEVKVDPTACAFGARSSPAADPPVNRVVWEWWAEKVGDTPMPDVEIPFEVRPPEPCAFEVTKQWSPYALEPGGTVTFTIRVTNVGASYWLSGFWPTTILFDVFRFPLEDVTVVSTEGDYSCGLLPKDEGVPPPPLDWLPPEAGTLLWCTSPPRNSFWTFPAGTTYEFVVTGRVPGDLDPALCEPIENQAGFHYGFFSFHDFSAGQIVYSDEIRVPVNCRSASPTPTGSPSPTPTGSPSPTPTGSPSPAPTGSPSPTPTPSASGGPGADPTSITRPPAGGLAATGLPLVVPATLALLLASSGVATLLERRRHAVPRSQDGEREL